MKEPHIELIFPTPIMLCDLDRSFTDQELVAVDKHRNLASLNVGNQRSNNSYILEEPEFKELKQVCLDAANQYMQRIYKPKYPVGVRITQSWVNWTEPNGFHHVHTHTNSFINGTLYIRTNPAEDKIKFLTSGYSMINLETDHYDKCNSIAWDFPVNAGQIILFPSNLKHMVDTVTSKETRISLSFNTFLTGTIGDANLLTELKL